MRDAVPRRPVLPAAVVVVVVVVLVAPAAADAATVHAFVPVSASIFGSIGKALFGAFTWTFSLATKFFMITFGALVKMLIPRSWAKDGVAIMDWIVAVPNYAGKITTPGGGRAYAFSGINSLRQLLMWLGIAIAPLTLTHAIARSMIDDQEPVAIPILRMVTVAAGILLYPYLWAQAADLADQVTHLILGLPDVTDGINKLMDYAVDGVALGGWQLIDFSMMGAIGLALLGLIFMKVVIILLGALLFATGPLMIGLVPTRFGHSLARAWSSAVMFLLTVGIAWATLFAVGALLIDDAGTAGPLIAGNSTFGSLTGGLLLAVAGLATLWLCLKATREAGGLLRAQLGGLLALGAGALSAPGSTRAAPAVAATTGRSLRAFSGRIAAGAGAAGGQLADAIPGGAPLRTAMSTASAVGRRGLIGTAGVAARYAARQAPPTAAALGASRAGQVAVAAARKGTAATTTLATTAAVASSRPHPTSPGMPRPAHARHRPPTAGPTTAQNTLPVSGATITHGQTPATSVAATRSAAPGPTTTSATSRAPRAPQSTNGNGGGGGGTPSATGPGSVPAVRPGVSRTPIGSGTPRQSPSTRPSSSPPASPSLTPTGPPAGRRTPAPGPGRGLVRSRPSSSTSSGGSVRRSGSPLPPQRPARTPAARSSSSSSAPPRPTADRAGRGDGSPARRPQRPVSPKVRARPSSPRPAQDGDR